MNRRTFLLWAAGITLLAFGLREWFVLTAVIPQPNQGDVGAYLRYAMHLVWHGVYTQAEGGQPVIPDAYRSPGYPWLLAVIFRFTGTEGWYPVIYQVQVVLGTATVAGVIALSRQWMSRGLALAAGAWMALQPHNIAATGAILTEVLFGACIIAALVCSAVALKRRSLWISVLAGAVFGFGYLVNPVLALFPVALVVVFWRAGALRYGMIVLMVSLVAVAGWSARNAMVGASGNHRAVENFVQGSWQEYHHAAHWWPLEPQSQRVLDNIKAESAAIKKDPAAIGAVFDRLADQPLRTAKWYFFQKPYLLWEWDIRMGQGGHYQIGVADSPLDHWPLLGPVIVQWALNPLAFALALLGIVLAYRGPPAFQMTALFAVYITAVHVVFQAEPRYAIPYRGIEIILAVYAIMAVRGWVIRLRTTGRWSRWRASWQPMP